MISKRYALKKGNNKGVAVIEVILILVVLIALIVIFKDQAVSLVTKLWNAIFKGANGLVS